MAETVYSLEQISAWQSQLKDFSKTPRTRFSKKQAVEALIDEIEQALQTHPYEEVAEQMKAWGLDIAAGSLKQYVNAYRRKHGTEVTAPAKKRSRRKPTGKARKKTKPRSPSQQTASQTDSDLKPVGNTQTDVKAAKPKPKTSESQFIEIDEEEL